MTNSTEQEKFRYVKSNDFCIVNADYDELNVKSGDMVYVCGDGLAPESEDDPYLVRMVFAIVPMDGDHVRVDVGTPLVIKGNFLEVLPEERQKELQEVFIQDHSVKDEGDEEDVSAA